MDNNFFNYLQQLEMMAFFSGFPLVYAFVFVIAGKKQVRRDIMERTVRLLPVAYALAGTLWLGLQLKNLYPDYSPEHISLAMQNPWLTVWGLLSILFWIPLFSKRPLFALIHSLVFFFFLLKELFYHSLGKSDTSTIRNYMKIYTDSLLLNLICLVFLLAISYLLFNKKQSRS
jgi:hypothetical protein